MKGLDGIQGPVYVGTGCVFKRQALYGYDPPKGPKRPKMVSCDCCPCFGSRKKYKEKSDANGEAAASLKGYCFSSLSCHRLMSRFISFLLPLPTLCDLSKFNRDG